MKKGILLIYTILFIVSCGKKQSPPQTNPNPSPDTTAAPSTQRWIVSTLAGSGTAGYNDADTTLARFSDNMQALALDTNGNLFVGDIGNLSIREITPVGSVSTYAGSMVGDPDPQFKNIFGIVVDEVENVFDMESDFIRKIGVQKGNADELWAGSYTMDYKDGQDTAARLNFPGNMAIAVNGIIYFPDYDKNDAFQIREATTGGYVGTLTISDHTGVNSDGTPNLHFLYAIAVNPLGGLYVTAQDNDVIKKVDTKGTVTVFAGNGAGFTDGQGTAAQFNNIQGIACDPSGNLYVSDGANNAIRMVTPGGAVSTIAGKGTPGFADGDSTTALFKNPFGIAVNSAGVIYVVDQGNYRVRKIQR
jgi:hypothetical protein